MNSSKLKWFLIALFLAVNVYFIYEYKSYHDQLKYYTEEEIEIAVKVLSDSGSPINKNAIPTDKTILPVLKLGYTEKYRNNLAKSFIKGTVGSYVLPGGIGFTDNNETFVFYDDGTFEYVKSSDETVNTDIKNKLQSKKICKEGEKLVSRLSDKVFPISFTASYKMTLSAMSAFCENGKTYARAKQLINGTTIESSEIYVIFNKDEAVYFSGKLCFTSEFAELSADSLDPINMLFTIPVQGEEIVKIEKVYYPVNTDGGAIYLTPSYKTYHKNGSVHVWDATSCVQRY